MKTTLNLDDRLLAEAKAQAAVQRTTLTRLIEEGLVLRLRGAPAGVASAKRQPKLPVLAGRGGLQPGVVTGSNKALLAALGDDA